jgi:hypothetical protein
MCDKCFNDAHWTKRIHVQNASPVVVVTIGTGDQDSRHDCALFICNARASLAARLLQSPKPSPHLSHASHNIGQCPSDKLNARARNAAAEDINHLPFNANA